MAHYGMLRDYHFSGDVDDIRGASIYAADDVKLGKVEDVIFDHDTGAINSLIVHMGHRARVLVPSDHVFRAVTDEDSFQTDLSSEDAERLPEFDEHKLQDERQWRSHQQDQDQIWREHEKKLRDQYKKGWHEAPVQHRHGTDRNVTPDETPAPAEGPAGERRISAAELFPEPLAGKFPGVSGPMTVPSTNQAAEDPTLRPAGAVDRAQKAAWGNLPPSSRWSEFQESIRTNLSSIRERCPRCCQVRESRVA